MMPKQVNHKHQGNEGFHLQAQLKKRFDTKVHTVTSQNAQNVVTQPI